MATLSISLPDAMKEWVEKQAQGSAYGTCSDYVLDLIQKDQISKAKVAQMQALVNQALESGSGIRSMDDLRSEALKRAQGTRISGA